MYLLSERDWQGLPHVVAALALIGAALALLFVSVGPGEQSVPSSEPVAAIDAGQRPAISVRTEHIGEVFTAARAAFQVSVEPGRGWAAAIRRRDPGAGHRWLVLAVGVGNLGRRHFNPALLSYLLRGRGGALFAPERAGVVGPTGLGEASGLPVGARAEERLVYRVPAGLRGASLTIQPSPAIPLEIRVPLGRGPA